MKILDPGNTQVIKHLYAVVSVDKAGNEGIMAFQSEDTWKPMITGEYRIAKTLMEKAKDVPLPDGKTLKLLRFDRK